MKLMGMIVFLGMFLVSSVFAQSRQELQRRAQRVTQNLQRVFNRNADIMSDSELRNYIQTTKRAIRIARGASQSTFRAKVTMEETSFLMEFDSLDQFLSVCSNKVESLRIRTTDDMNVEINGQNPVSLRKVEGFWQTPRQHCMAAAYLAISSAQQQSVSLTYRRYLLSGIANDYGLFAEGNTLDELTQSCEAHFGSRSVTMDRITVSLNGGEIQTSRNSGWWRTGREVCSVAISSVF